MDKISKTEVILYEAMLDIGLRPERQYKISRMKVDFAFPKEKLVIEVDGSYKRNSAGMKTLFERRRACEHEGWKVENFTAEEVFENPKKVAWRIFHMLKGKEPNRTLKDYEPKIKNVEENTKENITFQKEPFIWMLPEYKSPKQSPKEEKIIIRKNRKLGGLIVKGIIILLLVSLTYFLFSQNKELLNGIEGNFSDEIAIRFCEEKCVSLSAFHNPPETLTCFCENEEIFYYNKIKGSWSSR
jgi:very-short-patch-repair endonuclease